jgi:hypothetical protein
MIKITYIRRSIIVDLSQSHSWPLLLTPNAFSRIASALSREPASISRPGCRKETFSALSMYRANETAIYIHRWCQRSLHA